MRTAANRQLIYVFPELSNRYQLQVIDADKLSANDAVFNAPHYHYDAIGNITQLANAIPFVPSFPRDYGSHYGKHDGHRDHSGHGDGHEREHNVWQMGQSKQIHEYDDLNRLTKSTGDYQVKRHEHEDDDGDGRDDEEHDDDKEHARPHGIYTDRYQLDLAYDPIHNLTQKVQRHERVSPKGKVKRVRDTSYAWHYGYSARRPHAPEQIGRRHFLYDNNGNLYQSNTQDDKDHEHGSFRRLVWDEENRLRRVFQGHDHDEHDGKADYHEEGSVHYLYNEAGERVIKHVHDEEVVYVNSLYVVKNHGIVTKNVMVGSNRLLSKVHHRHHHPDSDGDNSTKRYEHGPYLFYYQSNHLGSTQFITDRKGELYQHLEDFPFGETWVDEGHRPSIDYRFTGKELDAETGLVYFGARYYDPRTSIWISADPILESYLDGKPNGGVFNPMNLGLYSYSHNRPVLLFDPDGLAPYYQDFMGFWMDGQHGRFNTYIGETKPEGSSYKEIVLINGGYYHKNTMNLGSRVINYFGGDAVDHKEYDPSSEQFFNTVLAVAPAGGAYKGVQLLKFNPQRALDAWKAVSKEQKNLIQQFFGKQGHKGMDKLEKSFEIPKGLTKDTLQKYAGAARRQIERGLDKNGVQQRRLEAIKKALELIE